MSETGKLSRRQFLKISATSVAAAGLAACKPNETPRPVFQPSESSCLELYRSPDRDISALKQAVNFFSAGIPEYIPEDPNGKTGPELKKILSPWVSGRVPAFENNDPDTINNYLVNDLLPRMKQSGIKAFEDFAGTFDKNSPVFDPQKTLKAVKLDFQGSEDVIAWADFRGEGLNVRTNIEVNLASFTRQPDGKYSNGQTELEMATFLCHEKWHADPVDTNIRKWREANQITDQTPITPELQNRFNIFGSDLMDLAPGQNYAYWNHGGLVDYFLGAEARIQKDSPDFTLGKSLGDRLKRIAVIRRNLISLYATDEKKKNYRPGVPIWLKDADWINKAERSFIGAVQRRDLFAELVRRVKNEVSVLTG